MNEPYEPFTPGVPHPTPVRHTQTSKLAKPNAISDAEMETLLAPELRGGVLSAVQLDAVVLARRAHLQNQAFLVGDSTGIGKGRTGVGSAYNGLLLDAREVVGRRVVYFSTAKVIEALMRDVRDFRLSAKVVDLRSSRGIPRGSDCILFVSYYSLPNKSKGGSETNAEFVARFIREAPNAGTVPLIIDESHNVKNCHGKGAAKSAAAAFQLFQNVRDETRMTFMSATPASCIEHLRLYAPFVGFVGSGSAPGAFPSFDRLLTKLGSNKDASSLEFLSAEAVRTGCMVSRTLGFDGVEFSQHTVEMSEAWCAQHDAATEVFDAILATGLFGGMKRSGLFYSASLRFFKSLVLNGKVAQTLEVARDRLRKGMQVVVAMMGTGEAASARAVKKSREGNGGGVCAVRALKRRVE